MIELKTLAERLGFDDEALTDVEKFDEAFSQRYVKKDEIDDDTKNAIIGKRMGSIETAIKRALNVTPDEIAGKKVEEVIAYAADKFKTEIETLQSAVKDKAPEVDRLMLQLKDIEKERDQYKGMVKLKDEELKGVSKKAEESLKSMKVDFFLSNEKSGLVYSETASDLTKKGFDLHLREKFRFDLDAEGNFVALDAKTGAQIENDAKTGFLTPSEVIKREAALANLLKLSTGGNKPNPKDVKADEPAKMVSHYGDQPRRKLSPLAIKIAGK